MRPFDKLDTGWMSPSGEFYPAGYMEHLAVADEIWNAIYATPPPNDVDRRLVILGWCEIQCITYMEHGFLFNFERHLTPEQKRIIKPVIEDCRDRLIKSSLSDLEEELWQEDFCGYLRRG